jgi:hypothetical protein
MVTSMARRLSALAMATSVWACASSPAMRAAASGDRVGLRALIDEREAAGTLSDGEAASLAHAVAAHDLRASVDPDAPLRVSNLQACARELDDALEARMRTRDAGGARAALARIESGGLGLDSARDSLSDPIPEWRAVGARGLVRSKDREARWRAFLDPDPGVRRQAARAARDAADGSDLDTLAEVARLDPEPIVRTEAVRAMSALPPVAGPRTALVLRDLWTIGDGGLREDIARAWSSSSVWSNGGRDALRIVIASEHGPGVIDASSAVLARRDAGDELSNLAIAAMVASMASDPRPVRLQAIAEAPLDRTEILAAVRGAAQDDDRAVRIAALGRLARLDTKAREELEGLAAPGARSGNRARFALALAGDRRVQLWIEQDLTAAAPEGRLYAATALAALGVASRAAPLLADSDPSVRDRAACTIMMATRIAQ